MIQPNKQIVYNNHYCDGGVEIDVTIYRLAGDIYNICFKQFTCKIDDCVNINTIYRVLNKKVTCDSKKVVIDMTIESYGNSLPEGLFFCENSVIENVTRM